MLYPMFVNLKGKRCVVVGAGSLAEKRVDSLHRHGATIRLVAPQATQTLKQLASLGVLTWMRSLYSPAHLEGAFLVIAATDLREINETVSRDANERNVLVCCADDPSLGNYLTGASVTRGDFQISLTTTGASPTLTSVLRSKLDRQFGSEWAEWVQLFAIIRKDIRQLPTELSRKSAVEEILIDKAVNGSILNGEIDIAVEAATKCISSQLV